MWLQVFHCCCCGTKPVSSSVPEVEQLMNGNLTLWISLWKSRSYTRCRITPIIVKRGVMCHRNISKYDGYRLEKFSYAEFREGNPPSAMVQKKALSDVRSCGQALVEGPSFQWTMPVGHVFLSSFRGKEQLDEVLRRTKGESDEVGSHDPNWWSSSWSHN